MIEITFIYHQTSTEITCKINDKVKDICEKFCFKAQEDINKLAFMYGGEILQLQKEFNQIISESDKNNNKMKILVCNYNP